jgi:N-acetylglucosamine kinase-like BadF-type ATPase
MHYALPSNVGHLNSPGQDMSRYFLGIDIGASKSHALIADESGNALGFGFTGPGNWETVGWERTRQVFHQITEMALASAGIGKDQIAGAGFGIAGYDWPEDLEPHQEIVNSLGLRAPCCLTNDTIIGLVAGATEGWGIVVSAGTSSNCRGRDKNGREGRLTGSGEMFAEYGGAQQIVRKAIQSISLAWSLRGPETQLTDAFLRTTGAADATALLAGLIRGRFHLSAADALLVFEVANQGDPVAQDIITWAGRELGNLAIGVARQLDFLDSQFEVVLAGSLYKGGIALEDALRETIHAVAPDACLVRLNAPPVVGGVLLGMERASLDRATIRPKLLDTTAQFLNDSESS